MGPVWPRRPQYRSPRGGSGVLTPTRLHQNHPRGQCGRTYHPKSARIGLPTPAALDSSPDTGRYCPGFADPQYWRDGSSWSHTPSGSDPPPGSRPNRGEHHRGLGLGVVVTRAYAGCAQLDALGNCVRGSEATHPRRNRPSGCAKALAIPPPAEPMIPGKPYVYLCVADPDTSWNPSTPGGARKQGRGCSRG